MAESVVPVAVPKVTPQEQRKNRIIGVLGTAKGWAFVEYRKLEQVGKSELTGARLKDGVVIKNQAVGKTLFVGLGEAKKFTDVQLPSRRKPAAPKTKDAVQEGPAGSTPVAVDPSALDALADLLK